MDKDNTLSIPISIIIAGLIIAGSIFLTQGPRSDSNTAIAVNTGNDVGQNIADLSNFRLPRKTDHIKGSSDAKISVVEFSDFECPFCGRIHPTFERLISERSEVNWIYRHFPLSQIHSNAFGAAVASECVAKLAGNDAFWSFADSLFLNQSGLGQHLYEGEAQKLGIDLASFQSCLEDDKIAQIVRDDSSEATSSGGRGTPFSVIITEGGEFIPFSGALPYEQIVALVDQALEI
jgi:protein-disulfide isomerase